MTARRTIRAPLAGTAALALLVAFVSPAHALKATADTNGGQQECAPGVEHFIAETPSVISRLGMVDAWELSRGRVLVAVVDSGVAASNAHLVDAVEPGADFVDSTDGRVDDSGHGTAIAGQIAARPVDGSGLVGLAPDARILPVRVYADSSDEAIRAGRGPQTSRTAKGIRWAADRGAVIIAVPSSTSSDDPELRAAVEYATAMGSLVVASAGNAQTAQQAEAVHFPAGYPQALSVTAVDAQGLPAESVVHGTHVEVAAPGSQVLTTFLGSGDCLFAPSTPTSSYATGYVAAIAALVAFAYPTESPAQWEYRLTVTALRPTPSERTKTLGWGIVAPREALNFTNDGTAVGPVNPTYPAAAQQAPRIMPRPAPFIDPDPARHRAVGAIAGAGSALIGAIAVLARLRKTSSKTKPVAKASER